ncbi:UNVERIFIED_CONTAM: hypothetical protein Sindi_2051900, partial [Sesamum indicum]
MQSNNIIIFVKTPHAAHLCFHLANSLTIASTSFHFSATELDFSISTTNLGGDERCRPPRSRYE